MAKKQILAAAAIAVVIHSAQLNLAGERCDAGSTLTVGEDISAVDALDLFERGQCSAPDVELIEGETAAVRSERQHAAQVALGEALEKASADEKAMQESAEQLLRDTIQNGIVKTEDQVVEEGAARLLEAGKQLEAEQANRTEV